MTHTIKFGSVELSKEDDEYIITNSNGYSIAMSESALEELMEIALLSVFEE